MRLKLIWKTMAIVAVVAFLVGCGSVPARDSVPRDSVPTFDQPPPGGAPTAPAAKAAPAAPAKPAAAAPAPAQQVPAKPAAQPAGQIQAPDFSQYVGKPYELIGLLDAQQGKTPQPSTNFTIDARDGDILYWTGAYLGNLPQGFTPLVVDGQTGVFMVPRGTMVTVNFVGAYMQLTQFNPNAQIRRDSGQATGCMPTAEVVNVLNTYSTDRERIFRELDRLTNVEGAPYLSARLRPTPDGPATYTVANTRAVWWVRSGSISGNVVELASSQGKSVYLASSDGQVNLTHAHAGAVLCEPLNTARLPSR